MYILSFKRFLISLLEMFLTQKTFIPFIDCALFSKESIDGNGHFLEKAIYIEDSPKDVIKKLYMSKTIMIHPDNYDKWTDIILVLVLVYVPWGTVLIRYDSGKV